MTMHMGRIAVVAMAVPFMTIAVEGDIDKAVKLNDEGVRLMQKGEIKKAITNFKAAIDADVHYVESAHNLGKLLIAAKQYALAEKILLYVVSENPNDMGSYVQIAQSAALRGDAETAKKAVENIAKGDKSLLPSLALLLSGQKTQELAEFTIGRSVETDPQNAEVWYDKGIITQRAKKFSDAEIAYGKAVTLKPSYSDAWVNLGNVQDAQGKTEEALASYEKAHAANSDSSLALYNLGRMLALKGKDSRRGLELLQLATKHGNEPGANAARKLLLHLIAETKKGGVK